MKLLRILKAKTFWWFALVVGVAILSVIALFMGAGVTLEWDDKKIDLRPGPKATPSPKVQTTEDIDLWRIRYDGLLKKHQELVRNYREFRQRSVEISRLPEQLHGTPDEVLLWISNLVDYCNTIWYCCQVISTQIAQRVSIDTNGPPDDKQMEEAYKCLQMCLRAIGFYSHEINGDWRATSHAVLRFQEARGLMQDGKVGRETWIAILRELAEAMHGASLSGEISLIPGAGQWQAEAVARANGSS